MSADPANQENQEQPIETLPPEVLDKIKHPPAMDDVLRNLPPEEVATNPGVMPQSVEDPVE